MTVEQLISELQKVNDKSKQVYADVYQLELDDILTFHDVEEHETNVNITTYKSFFKD